MSQPSKCPAMFVSAPASGQGKTTVTALLARYFRNQGYAVHVFKTGPDYLDPMVLAHASGNPVYQLDLWMVGKEQCQSLLNQAAQVADLIIIEGVMGLYDGTPSSADLAEMFGIPILAVIDAGSMAQTFGALVKGLKEYRPSLPFAGVLANRVASPHHAEMLMQSLPEGVVCFGYLSKNQNIEIPSRHLGLMQADEIDSLDRHLDAAIESLHLPTLDKLPAPIIFPEVELPAITPLLDGVRIGIARDSAFSFIYQANLDLLESLGALLHFFSPISDSELPEIDSLWLPGGYPELYAKELSNNQSMMAEMRAHHQAGKPILAECGGMVYLFETLTDQEGEQHSMTGLLSGNASMQSKLAGIGMQSVDLNQHELRGHTFHYSTVETTLEPIARGKRQSRSGEGEAVYRDGRLTASYLHLYFPSSAEAVAQLFLP